MPGKLPLKLQYKKQHDFDRYISPINGYAIKNGYENGSKDEIKSVYKHGYETEIRNGYVKNGFDDGMTNGFENGMKNGFENGIKSEYDVFENGYKTEVKNEFKNEYTNGFAYNDNCNINEIEYRSNFSTLQPKYVPDSYNKIEENTYDCLDQEANHLIEKFKSRKRNYNTNFAQDPHITSSQTQGLYFAEPITSVPIPEDAPLDLSVKFKCSYDSPLSSSSSGYDSSDSPPETLPQCHSYEDEGIQSTALYYPIEKSNLQFNDFHTLENVPKTNLLMKDSFNDIEYEPVQPICNSVPTMPVYTDRLFMQSPVDSFRDVVSPETETKRRQRQSKAYYENLSEEEKKERHRKLDNERSRQYRTRRRMQKNSLMQILESEQKRNQDLQITLKQLSSEKIMFEKMLTKYPKTFGSNREEIELRLKSISVS